MAKKVCLAAIYNHQFPSNVDKLEKVYKGKFDKIWHIMPFYKGDDSRVITVYENSYQFQGYIAQSIDKIYEEDFDYYIFMGDDVLMRPDFSNETIEEILKIDENTSFIARNIRVINNALLVTRRWLMPSVLNYIYSDSKSEFEKKLPSINDMIQKYKSLNLKCPLLSENKIRYTQEFFGLANLYNFFYKYNLEGTPIDAKKFLNEYKEKDDSASVKYMFPLALGFSDLFVVPKKFIKDFARYCGIFAAVRIFAEVAVPTALCIASDKVNKPEDIGLKVVNYCSTDERRKQLPEKYEKSIKKVLEQWENENILLHPVKYSIWNIDID